MYKEQQDTHTYEWLLLLFSSCLYVGFNGEHTLCCTWHTYTKTLNTWNSGLHHQLALETEIVSQYCKLLYTTQQYSTIVITHPCPLNKTITYILAFMVDYSL